ncbi:MAG: uroporphyrinogen decarboxylase family protein [bacterium]|jgi:uroporphyrinogen decarboxylase
MTSRERVGIALDRGVPDRVPIHDGYWDEAVQRWRGEGMPEAAARDRDSIWDYFDMEIRQIPIDPSFMFEEKVIADDERYILKRVSDGGVYKYIKGSTATPGLVEFPLKGRREWQDLKERLRPSADRLPADLRARYRKYREDGRFVVIVMHNPYEATWSKFGVTNLLESMKLDPELVREVFAAVTDMNLAMCEEILGAGYEVDGGWIWGDIAYNKGTLFSIRMYEDLLQPFNKRLAGFFRERGLPVVYHTDGDVRTVIPLLIEAGMTCLQPLESKANMDLVELKREYGDRLAFMGGIDFEAISKGEASMIEEIRSKVGRGKEGGGYIYHSDHSVPPKVSLDQYRRVLDLVLEYGRY